VQVQHTHFHILNAAAFFLSIQSRLIPAKYFNCLSLQQLWFHICSLYINYGTRSIT